MPASGFRSRTRSDPHRKTPTDPHRRILSGRNGPESTARRWQEKTRSRSPRPCRGMTAFDRCAGSAAPSAAGTSSVATATHPPFLSTSILARTALMPANGDTGESFAAGPARRPCSQRSACAGSSAGFAHGTLELGRGVVREAGLLLGSRRGQHERHRAGARGQLPFRHAMLPVGQVQVRTPGAQDQAGLVLHPHAPGFARVRRLQLQGGAVGLSPRSSSTSSADGTSPSLCQPEKVEPAPAWGRTRRPVRSCACTVDGAHASSAQSKTAKNAMAGLRRHRTRPRSASRTDARWWRLRFFLVPSWILRSGSETRLNHGRRACTTRQPPTPERYVATFSHRTATQRTDPSRSPRLESTPQARGTRDPCAGLQGAIIRGSLRTGSGFA